MKYTTLNSVSPLPELLLPHLSVADVQNPFHDFESQYFRALSLGSFKITMSFLNNSRLVFKLSLFTKKSKEKQLFPNYCENNYHDFVESWENFLIK